MNNHFINDDLSEVHVKPQFVSDPADEVLADYDNHEALTKRGFFFLSHLLTAFLIYCASCSFICHG